MKVLFFYLKGFSFTGGIEKFNRSFLKALHELSVDGDIDADAVSVYDNSTDEKYFPAKRFKGYNGSRIPFILGAIIKSFRYRTIVIGHINLALVGCIIKRIKPSVKVVLIAHGIEVWKKHSGIKLELLATADAIFAVSNFTKEKIKTYNPTVDVQKIKIFPNTLDPYFKPPKVFDKPEYLVKRYDLNPGMPILLTVTRLSFAEKYKGYDSTIELMKSLSRQYKGLRYLICGKSDEFEKQRIDNLIRHCEVEGCVTLTDFVTDEELVDHYLLADIFVMPSKKEGFGIVFIEAMACGRRVIAGSKDGSVDALMNGELGKLVDPDNENELKQAIIGFLDDTAHDPEILQKKVLTAFGFSSYKERLRLYLNH